MATTVFKGAIGLGTISAKFQSDFSNIDSDLITISHAAMGGANPQVDTGIAAPGGFATVRLTASTAGVLEVMVATGQVTDSGRLEVSLNGALVDQGPVQDSVRWIYAVQP